MKFYKSYVSGFIGLFLLSSVGCTSIHIVPNYDHFVVEKGDGTSLDMLPVLDDTVTIPISINGDSGYKFLFDTGSQFNVIFDSSSINQLMLEKLSYKGAKVTGGGGDKQTDVSFTSPLTLGVGEISLRDVIAIEIPWQALGIFPNSTSVFWDGVLGYPILEHFAVDVDIRANKLQFYRSDSETFELNVASVDFQKIPLIVENNNIFVSALFSSDVAATKEPKKLLLDTGYNGAVKLHSDHGLNLALEEKTVKSTGLGGTSQARKTTIEQMFLSELSLTKIPTNVDVSEKNTRAYDGKIGIELLNRGRFIINLQNNYLYFKPYKTAIHEEAAQLKASFKIASYGPKLEKKIIVSTTKIAKEAGLQNGDVLLSINDIEAKFVHPGQVASLLSKSTNQRKSNVCVERLTDSLCFSLKHNVTK